MKKNFKQLSAQDISVLFEQLGLPSYRSKQVIQWIYKRLACSFDEMSNLPKQLRITLNEIAFISNLKLVTRQLSQDGTKKFLFQLTDGEYVESVLIPNSTGNEHYTLCISSQVGCSLACKFCSTGKLGLKRNLLNHEIVDQIMAVKKLISSENTEDHKISNIVFMGMGEPLNNLNEVIQALWKITGLMGYSKMRVTVSTAGIVPRIYELAQKGPAVNLAISLNATTDAIRNRIMPVNKKYPLKTLIQACRDYPLQSRRLITFEYILLDGINASITDAHQLVSLLHGIRAKINLIPYNPPESEADGNARSLKSPDDDKILEFQNVLKKSGVTTLIRKSMGADINAACGQLKAAYLDKNNTVPSS
jgi:23S rRNA (adenine2503-C2)-methyltransferase